MDRQRQEGVEGALAWAARLREEAAQALAQDAALAGAYGELLNALRDLSLFDPRQGEPSAKPFARLAQRVSPEARRAFALKGGADGAARGLIQHLGLLELSGEDRFAVALLCAQEDPEKTLTHLTEAALTQEQALQAVLAALGQIPVLDFAEFKSLETLFMAVDTGGSREAQDLQRRYEQARGRRAQHARRHLFGQVPPELMRDPGARLEVLGACLDRDPFGTLDHFRELGVSDPCEGLDIPLRLDLLDRVAARGLGLASNHLDLFGIPAEPRWEMRLREILRMDLTAGSSVLGVHALEGAHHYPFGLESLQPVLPRRISSAEALLHLKRGEPEDAKPRSFTSGEVADTAARLQELEVHRFLSALKSDLARGWRTWVQDRKREILFADPDLRIRNVLFLLGHTLFEPEEAFEAMFRLVQKSHPMYASDTPRILLLANRYAFLEVLGLNPALLFNRAPRPSGGARTLIEEAGDFPVRSLLHVGMSIHLQVGDELFRAAPIAWNILMGQYEGRVDPVIQDLTFLFDGFDTLFTIAASSGASLKGWVGPLVDALVADAQDLPPFGAAGAPQATLRLTTRTTLDRCRERLGPFCLEALKRAAQARGVSPINVIQSLRMPRNKTDKLRAMLEMSRRRS